MQEARVQIDQHGRLLFPSKIRKEHGIKSGDIFIMRVVDEKITLMSLDKVVQNAQALFRKHIPEGKNVVDDFIQDRREQSRLEEKRYETWGNKK